MAPDEMDGVQLRQAMAKAIESLHTLRTMYRDAHESAVAIQGRLLNGPPDVRLAKGEGIPTKYGTLKAHTVTKGRAWVAGREVDKDAGELGDLAPKADERIVIEHASDLPTAIAAELRGLAKGEDAVVTIVDKAKYPTVGELRKKFGEDTKYVVKPPSEEFVVLVKGDDILLSVDGVK